MKQQRMKYQSKDVMAGQKPTTERSGGTVRDSVKQPTYAGSPEVFGGRRGVPLGFLRGKTR